MQDLSVLFLTVNKVPKKWAAFHYAKLLEAVGDAHLLTISKEPMPGHNLIQTEDASHSNVYKQLLRGAKEVNTEYIAVAEDDCLYPPDHFLHRPKTLAYNMHRWSVFTWGDSLFSWRDRFSNFSLIAKRELVIQSLEERFAKYPDGTEASITGEIGRWRTDAQLKVTHYEPDVFWSKHAIINVSHEYGLDDRARRHRKSHGMITAYDVPLWGKASFYQDLWKE